MVAVVESICAIAALILVGWFARRTGALGPATTSVLADLTYWVTTPALLFHAISAAPVHDVLGAPLAVAAASGVGTALLFVALARPLLRARGGDLVLGAMSASLNNAAHIGIPIAVYVLGQASHGVPIMVFQLGFFTPMYFVLADLIGSGRHPGVRGVARLVATNPMVLAAAVGLLVSWFALPVPRVVSIGVDMLAGAAPPLVLIAFGTSLVGENFRLRSHQGALVAAASVGKLVVQPVIAHVTGVLLGLEGESLMAVTVMAALPTAQNAFIAATRSGTGQDVARGSVLVTTFASLPVTVLIAAAFHSGLLG